MLMGGAGRAPRGAAVVARERMSVEREDVRARGVGRASRGATVGACERMSVGHNHVLVRGVARAPRGASVGARERMSVGCDDMLARESWREHRAVELGDRKRLPDASCSPTMIRKRARRLGECAIKTDNAERQKTFHRNMPINQRATFLVFRLLFFRNPRTRVTTRLQYSDVRERGIVTFPFRVAKRARNHFLLLPRRRISARLWRLHFWRLQLWRLHLWLWQLWRLRGRRTCSIRGVSELRVSVRFWRRRRRNRTPWGTPRSDFIQSISQAQEPFHFGRDGRRRGDLRLVVALIASRRRDVFATARAFLLPSQQTRYARRHGVRQFVPVHDHRARFVPRANRHGGDVNIKSVRVEFTFRDVEQLGVEPFCFLLCREIVLVPVCYSVLFLFWSKPLTPSSLAHVRPERYPRGAPVLRGGVACDSQPFVQGKEHVHHPNHDARY